MSSSSYYILKKNDNCCGVFYLIRNLAVILSLLIFDASEAYDDNWVEEQIRVLTGKNDELERKVKELEKETKFLGESLGKKLEDEKSEKEVDSITGKTPEEIIKMACDAIDDNNIEEACRILRLFIKKNPQDIHCGMMMFYLGEAYFKDKDYKNAVKEYKDSYTTNPDGTKAPEALYKLAICFKNLSKINEAKTILKKLMTDYPDSTNIVERAKKLNSTL
jgi:tol-pal system protein YbgF